jgi:hypothetical protein
VELKKSVYRLADDDPELKPWDDRLAELAGESDDIDDMLAEIEQRAADEAQGEARGQLELFGALLNDLAAQKHRIVREGKEYDGTWDDIVRDMRDDNAAYVGRPVAEFMQTEARRGFSMTGIEIPTTDAESFIRGAADAGLLRIVR